MNLPGFCVLFLTEVLGTNYMTSFHEIFIVSGDLDELAGGPQSGHTRRQHKDNYIKYISNTSDASYLKSLRNLLVTKDYSILFHESMKPSWLISEHHG